VGATARRRKWPAIAAPCLTPLAGPVALAVFHCGRAMRRGRLPASGGRSDWRRRWPPGRRWCCSVRGMFAVCQRLLCPCCLAGRHSQLSAAAWTRASRLARRRRRPIGPGPAASRGCWCRNHHRISPSPLRSPADQLQEHRRTSAPNLVLLNARPGRCLGEAAACPRSCWGLPAGPALGLPDELFAALTGAGASSPTSPCC